MSERNQFTPSQLEWLEGMESGAFKQGYGRLFRKGSGDLCGHCCLGIRAHQMNLCVDDDADVHEFGAEHAVEVAPKEVIEDLQLNDEAGGIAGGYGGYHYLTEMNDKGSFTFVQIAAFIRAYPWKVFKNFDRPKGAA